MIGFQLSAQKTFKNPTFRMAFSIHFQFYNKKGSSRSFFDDVSYVVCRLVDVIVIREEAVFGDGSSQSISALLSIIYSPTANKTA